MIVNNIPLKNIDFVILDLETTGFYAYDEIIEIGIIDKRGNTLYSSLIKPEKSVSSTITQITGITNCQLQKAPYFKTEWPKIKKILEGKVITTYNLEFDQRLLMQTLNKYKLDYTYAEKLFKTAFCSLEMYREFNVLGGSNKLEDACKREGIHIVQDHRAVSDCRLVLELYKAMHKKQPNYSFSYENKYIFCPYTYQELFEANKTILEVMKLKNVKEKTVRDNLKKLQKKGLLKNYKL